jgi:DNA-directed RNA polymerase subunit beta
LPIVKYNEIIDKEILEALNSAGIDEFELLFIDGTTSSDSVHKTLLLDKVEAKEDALIEIYRRLRPGNPATPEVAQDFVDHMFFKPSYYDLSSVGRMKINLRLGIDTSVDLRTLRKEDILLTAKTLRVLLMILTTSEIEEYVLLGNF